MRDQSESSLSIKESYTEELLPAKAISVILGLHDRSKDLEERRWNILCKPPLPFFFVFHHFQQEAYPGQQSDCPRELLKPYERHCAVETW